MRGTFFTDSLALIFKWWETGKKVESHYIGFWGSYKKLDPKDFFPDIFFFIFPPEIIKNKKLKTIFIYKYRHAIKSRVRVNTSTNFCVF